MEGCGELSSFFLVGEVIVSVDLVFVDVGVDFVVDVGIAVVDIIGEVTKSAVVDVGAVVFTFTVSTKVHILAVCGRGK